MLIREATLADLDVLVAIEQCVFSYPWSRAMFTYELVSRPDAISLVLEEEQTIIGYLLAQYVEGGVRILNLALDLPYQHRGFGKHLLQTFLHCYCNQRTITLEVKCSNLPALKLYYELGFEEVGLREGYYEDGEDALVLRLKPREQTVPQQL